MPACRCKPRQGACQGTVVLPQWPVAQSLPFQILVSDGRELCQVTQVRTCSKTYRNHFDLMAPIVPCRRALDSDVDSQHTPGHSL
jgi:hypothetical protein